MPLLAAGASGICRSTKSQLGEQPVDVCDLAEQFDADTMAQSKRHVHVVVGGLRPENSHADEGRNASAVTTAAIATAGIDRRQ